MGTKFKPSYPTLVLDYLEEKLCTQLKTVNKVFTIVQIIFHFLWDHWAHCGIFGNGVLLMYTLEGLSSVALLLMKSLNKKIQ